MRIKTILRAVFENILVKQQLVRFQIDCGASVSILPLKYAEGEELAPCSQTLVMWHGSKMKSVGTCALKVVNPRNNEKFKVRFLVVNERLTPLLGLNATEKMKLLTIRKENVGNVVEDMNSGLIVKYPHVFNKSLGTLWGKVHLQVDPDSKVVVLPACKIPVSVQEKFEEELKRLENLVVKNRLSGRSYEVELPKGILCRNRIHLRKTNKPAATLYKQ